MTNIQKFAMNHKYKIQINEKIERKKFFPSFQKIGAEIISCRNILEKYDS